MRLLSAFLFCASLCQAQAGFTGAADFTQSADGLNYLAGGTLSLAQDGSCTFSTGANSCTVTMSKSALATGNAYGILGQSADFVAHTITTVVSGTSTYTAGSSLTILPACSTTMGTQSYGSMCAVVLPISATGNSATVVINFSPAATGSGSFYIQEIHPSANGMNVGIANEGAYLQPTAASANVSPAFTPSGSSNWTMGSWMSYGAYVNVSTVSSPYLTNSYLPGAAGYAGAQSTAQITWTPASSSAGMAQGFSLAYNPTPYLPEMFTSFEAGTNNTTPTVATLMASTQGWQGCKWIVPGATSIKFLSAAAMALANGTGRLSDGSSYAAGAGTMGAGITWNGTDANDSMEFNCATGGSVGSPTSPSWTAGFWWYGDQSPTGGNNDDIDGATIHGSTDFAGFNYYPRAGNMTFSLETPEGTGSVFTVPPSTWLWFSLTYQAGNGTVGGTHSLSGYDCVSGLPPACTLQLIGTSTHTGSVSKDYPFKLQLGQQQGSDAPDSGTHSYWDSVKLYLGSTVILP